MSGYFFFYMLWGRKDLLSGAEGLDLNGLELRGSSGVRDRVRVDG